MNEQTRLPGWLDSLEAQAREVLPEAVHRYIRQGSARGVSARESVASWDRYRILPRVLRDVTHVETATSLLGTPTRSPFAVAPTTMQRAAHPDGEVAMARAVAEAGSLMVVSSNCGSTFAEIAVTGVHWWLQAYLSVDRSTCRPLLDRAVAAGAGAIVLTVDTPVVATKYDGGAETVWDIAEPGWLRVNFGADYGARPGDAKAADLGPRDIAWLGEVTGLPVVVKGVLRPDDARRCVEAGASAVWVSNHGGRQLDGAVAPADCVAAVAAELDGDAEVYVDGGVREARHGLVASALGARAVFLGRLPLYALASGGPEGVRRMLEQLDTDLVEVMRLAGCADLAAVTPDILR